MEKFFVFLLVPVLALVLCDAGEPEIEYLNIRSGSSSGETEISAHGTGLQEDPSGPGHELSSDSWKERHALTLNDEQSTGNILIFRTLPRPNGEYVFKAKINGKECKKMCVANRSLCTLRVTTQNTPNIVSVEPTSGEPGTVVKFCSDNMVTNLFDSAEAKASNGKTERIKRIKISDYKCHPTKLVGADKKYDYTFDPKTSKGCIKCQLGGTFVSNQNLTFIVEGPYGSSKPLPTSLCDMSTPGDNVNAMFQTYAVVSGSFSPASVSLAGGANLTITGKYFDKTVQEPRVTVGGKPCKNVWISGDTKMSCITPPIGTKKTLYPGGRGNTLEMWKVNYSPGDIAKISALTSAESTYTSEDLESTHVTFPSSPYAAKMYGNFVPAANGAYTFMYSADDFGKLYFSQTDQPKDKQLAVTTSKSGKIYYSQEYNLEARKEYYFEALATNQNGPGSVNIGIRSNIQTPFSESNSKDILNDMHRIEIASTNTDEIQVAMFEFPSSPGKEVPEQQNVKLTGTGCYQIKFDGASTVELKATDGPSPVQAALENLPGVGPGNVKCSGSSMDYTCTFSGNKGKRRKMEIVPCESNVAGTVTTVVEGKSTGADIFLEHNGIVSSKAIQAGASADHVTEAVKSVFSNKCPYDLINPPAAKVPCVQSFETEKNLKSKWSIPGDIIKGMAFCGRCSLRLYKDKATKINFACDGSKNGISLNNFKYLCFASHGRLADKVKVSYIDGKTNKPGHVWLPIKGKDISHKLVDPWEYRCMNVLELIKAEKANVVLPRLTAIELSRRNKHEEVFVDDLRLGQEEFDSQHLDTRRQAVKDSNRVEDVEVSQVSSKTHKIVLKAYNVSSGFALLQQYNNGGTASFSVKGVETASPPVTGSFTLKCEGKIVPDISAQALASEVRQHLLVAGVVPVHVWRGGTAAGYTWYITFTEGGGKHQPTTVVSSNLKGNIPTIKATVHRPGGNNYATIPGWLLQKAVNKMQANVWINGILSKCKGDCSVKYEDSSTPKVTAVAPSEGTKDDTVTVTGTGFSTDKTKVKVLIGSHACGITITQEKKIECKLGPGRAGTHRVSVFVAGKGKGIGDVDFKYKSKVTGASRRRRSPLKGKIGGGRMIEFTGNGFTNGHRVTINQKACRVVPMDKDSDGTKLKCQVPAAISPGVVDLEMFDPDGNSIYKTQYEYTAATAEVDALSTYKACVDGGTSFVATGKGFGNNPKAFVGGKEVKLNAAHSPTDTSFSGFFPSLPIGSYTFQAQATGSMDYAVNNNIQPIVYEFEVTDCSPGNISPLGGATIECNGKGFPTDKSQWNVKLGDTGVEVTSVTPTKFEGKMDLTRKIHNVTNEGKNVVHDAKYFDWKPRALTINQYDCVKWTFIIPPHITWPKWTYEETDGPSSTEPLSKPKIGFEKNRTAEGVCFQRAGTFYYWSGWINSQKTISAHGSVTVLPLQGSTARISIKAANHSPKMFSKRRKRAAGGTCNIKSPGGYFHFVSKCSPEITNVFYQLNTDHYAVKVTGKELISSKCSVTVFLKDHKATTIKTGTEAEVTWYPDKLLTLCKPYILKFTVNAKTNVGAANNLIPLTKTMEFKPTVDSCAPKLPAVGSCSGADLVCKGVHLLDSKGTSNIASILVGTKKCAITVTKSNNEITCRTPILPAGPHKIVVSWKTSCSTPKVLQFTCTDACTAKITNVDRFKYDASKGVDNVEIKGDRLWAATDTSVEVFVGKTKCTAMSSQITATQIDCTLATRTPGPQDVVIYRNPCGFSNTHTHTVVPSLVSVTPDRGSIHGGTVVKATGVGFVETVQVKLEQGGSVLTAVSVKIINSKTLEFITPASVPNTFEVRVIISSATSTESVKYTYDSAIASTPKWTLVTPNAITPGAATLTITGQGFLSSPCSDNAVKLCHLGDPTKCCDCTIPVAASCTNTKLTCEANSCPAGEYEVSVHVKGKGYATEKAGLKVKVDVAVTGLSPTEGSLAGGQIITFKGKGFGGPGASPEVTICSVKCPIFTDAKHPATATEFSCKVPATPGIVTKKCSVTLKAGYKATQTLTQEYYYKPDKTPVLTSVSPVLGGTAGGTVITIKGKNFGTDPNVLRVTIGGTLCPIKTLVSDTELVCTTGAHPDALLETITVESSKLGLSQGIVKFNYAHYWSSSNAWPGGKLPGKGAFVVIKKSATMIIDVDTAILKMLLVKGGHLRVDDTKDIKIKFENMLITEGGSFQAGTPDNPRKHQLLITMYGTPLSKELPLYGTKSMAVRNGTLDLHGRKCKKTWTRLAVTATQGSTTITVEDDVSDWLSCSCGKDIVIATTGHRHSLNETEEHEISSISGKVITLKKPLAYEHLGETHKFGTKTFHMKAEVGLLSRCIIVRGHDGKDWHVKIPKCKKGFHTGEFATQTCFQGRFGEETGKDQFGGHIIIGPPEPNKNLVKARLSSVEVRYAGQAFRLGRYPIHFHLCGNMNGSYVNACSIRETFNRAVNIHGTHEVEVKHNVIYNVMGGALFLEDGIETGNVFNGNFGVSIRSSTSLLNEDITPALFWITNPNNTYIGNRAAGGTHFGFWFRLKEHPDGPSFDKKVSPRNVPLGVFRDNSAHSFGWFGLWIFPEYFPRKGGNSAATEPEVAVVENFQTWRNEKGAEGVMLYAVQFSEILAVENEKAGIEMKRIVERPGMKHSMYRYTDKAVSVIDSTIVAWVSGYPVGPASGVVLPYGGGFLGNGITFYNYNRTNSYGTSIATIDGTCSDNCGGYTYWWRNTAWINSPYKASFKWVHEAAYYDLDGTFTGTQYTTVLPSSNLTNTPKCKPMADFSRGVPATGCAGPAVKVYRMAMNKPSPSSLSYKKVVVTNQYGSATGPHMEKRLTHKNGWMIMLVIVDDQPNQIAFEHSDHLTNISYTATLYYLKASDCPIIQHKLPEKPDRFAILPPPQKSNNVPSMVSCASNNGDYNWDDSKQHLSYVVKGKSPQFTEVPILFNVFVCFFENCKIPSWITGIPTSRDSWHNVSSWTHATNNCKGVTSPCPPKDGDVVIIPRGQWIFIDGNNGPVAKFKVLYVYGWLELTNSKATGKIHLKGYAIVVMGGKIFTSGSTGQRTYPMIGCLTIELLGDHSTPEIPKSKDHPKARIKVLAVYGEMDLYGPARDSWTWLAKPAKNGDKGIELDAAVDWKPDEWIVITTMSYKGSESERVQIDSVSGKKVELKTRLKYNHNVFKVTSATLKANNMETTLRAEVGLLSRCIQIKGAEYAAIKKEAFGASVICGSAYTANGAAIGVCKVRNVLFRNWGQLGHNNPIDPRFGFAYVNTGDSKPTQESFIKGSAFDWGYSTAIGAFGSHYIHFTNNVIHRPVSSGFLMTGKGYTIEKNLCTRLQWEGSYNNRNEPSNVEWPACYNLIDATDVSFKRNVVAGSDRAGIKYPGDSCVGSPTFEENTVHSVLIGIYLPQEKKITGCAKVSGFLVWRSYDAGIYTQTEGNMILENNILLDNRAATVNKVVGPPAIGNTCTHKTVTISKFLMGDSGGLDCTDDVDKNDYNIKYSENARPPLWGNSHVGILWPDFMSKNNDEPNKKFPGIMSYPTVCGHVYVKDGIALHNKKWTCGSKKACTYLISTNPMQEDHIHSMTVKGLTLDDVEEECKVFYHRPNVKRVNPADCVDMMCDGLKKALGKDEDCSLLGAGCTGSGYILPQAEYEWGGLPSFGIGDYRIPKTLLMDTNGKPLKTSVFKERGIYRKNCKKVPEWRAYKCSTGKKWAELVIESLDDDTETRRLSPVAVLTDEYIDLLNGPMDHGWCSGYTCQKRISTFYAIISTGKEVTVHFSSTNPQKLRLRLLDVLSTDVIVVHIFYQTSNRLKIYRGGTYVPALNTQVNQQGQTVFVNSGFAQPSITSPPGTNIFDLTTKLLTLVVQGKEYYDIIQETDSFVISFGTPPMTINEFYKSSQIVQNLAALLGIPKEDIFLVEITANTNPTGRRRRSTGQTKVSIQITSSKGYTHLLTLSAKLIDEIQKGRLSLTLGITVYDASVTPPPPKPGTPTYAAYITLMNSLPRGTPPPVGIPNSLIIGQHLEVASEGMMFKIQPSLKFTDAKGVPLTSVGTTLTKWTVSAKLRSGTGDPKATLQGVTMATFINGEAIFTDLKISDHGTGYIIDFTLIAPTLSSTKTVASKPFDVSKRKLRLYVTNLPKFYKDGQTFELKLDVVDSNDEKGKLDLNWKSHAWTATVGLDTMANHIGQVKATNPGSVDQAKNVVTFTGLSFTKKGSYALKVHLMSNPEGYTATLVQRVKVSDGTVYKTSKECKLRFMTDYSAISGYEDAFCVTVENDLNVKYSKVYFDECKASKGSIVVTIQVAGSEGDISAFLRDFYSQLKDYTIVFNGYTMKSDGTLEVDGVPYTENTITIIVAVVCSVVALAIIIGVSVYCAKKVKKKNKLNLVPKQSTASRIPGNFPNRDGGTISPVNDDKVSLHWQGMTPPPQYSASPLPSKTPPPPYREHLSPAAEGGRLSPVATISGQLSPPTVLRHGKQKYSGHMSTKAIRRISASKSPDRLRTSESITSIE